MGLKRSHERGADAQNRNTYRSLTSVVRRCQPCQVGLEPLGVSTKVESELKINKIAYGFSTESVAAMPRACAAVDILHKMRISLRRPSTTHLNNSELSSRTRTTLSSREPGCGEGEEREDAGGVGALREG